MAAETEETPHNVPWYGKFFEYWKNRNRVGPGRVELPDCDFFIVGSRRTLRILRPPLKGAWYYEDTSERPESVNDNFYTRWSRRPHSSGNCRCSFRHSRKPSTTEEKMISAELNRIRTSLCEAEKTGQDIEELERRLSVDLQKFQDPISEIKMGNVEAENINDHENSVDNETIDEQAIKSKIVKDLEKYINDLLEEILDDTVKVVTSAEEALKEEEGRRKRSEQKSSFRKNSSRVLGDDSRNAGSSSSEGSLDISFCFHTDNEKREDKEIEKKEEISANVGYVNRGFVGSSNDPDSLDFYLRHTTRTEICLENLDCIDSGINSVETVEFQPEQEPSLEQSLLRIIDEKLGRTPLENSWEDLSVIEKDEESQELKVKEGESSSRKEEAVLELLEEDRIEAEKSSEKSEGSEVSGKNNAESGELERRRVEDAGRLDISDDNLTTKPAQSLEDVANVANEPSFEKLRLEFKDAGKESSSRNKKANKTMTKLREKLRTNLDGSSRALKKTWTDKVANLEGRRELEPIELEDCKRKWPDFEEDDREETSINDSIVFRKIRKPTIVFLHGFGSSAEIFEHQLEYFSALGYPCIAPDMLGHGMSSAPGRARDYHFGKLLKDLDAVLRHYAFRPGQKCVLVAHNYGCSFATALACKYDANIHQLVLISGGGPTPLAPPSTESAGHWCLRAILAPFLMCGLHRGILYSARGRQHPYCGPEPQEQWPSHMKYILDGMLWPEGDYVYHRRICTPTLLIHGLRDNKVSLVQECQMERTMIKAFLEAIPAAGHTPMTDCPEQVNHMIHCFIDLWKNKKWQQ